MFNTIVALGTIALHIGLIALVIGWAIKARFVAYIAKHAGLFVAVLFTTATVLSFSYQYGLGFEPCLLCWYQRICIMPIALLAWTAPLRTSKLLQKQLLLLMGVGFAIALFHVILDVFPTGLDVCSPGGTSCLVRYVYEFGYITIPVMSLTTLAAGIVITLLAKYYPQQPLVESAK